MVGRLFCITLLFLIVEFANCGKLCNGRELFCLDSVKPQCRDENNRVIDCRHRQFFRPQSSAIFGCQYGFKNVDPVEVTCLEDGTWENISNISNACQFDCRRPGMAMSKHALQFKLQQVQSVVFIYEDINQTSNFTYSCAGTIIRPNVVLTAAHCVFHRNQKALRVIREVGKSYINISEGWAVEKIFYPSNYESSTFSLDVGILQLELKHAGDDMSNAICLPGYKNTFRQDYTVFRGNIDALLTLNNDANTVGNLTIVRGAVIERTPLEYKVALLSGSQLCQGDAGSGFIARCEESRDDQCLYGVLSRAVRISDGAIPCSRSVVVARTTHSLVQQFILGTLDQIENKCD